MHTSQFNNKIAYNGTVANKHVAKCLYYMLNMFETSANI